MESQPYIFKKQILACTLLCSALYIIAYLNRNFIKDEIIVVLFTLFVTLFITFLPYIYSSLKYPLWLHFILYNLPMFWVFPFVNKKNVVNIERFVYVFFITLCLMIIILLLSLKELKISICSKETKIPLNEKYFYIEIIKFTYSVVSEEFFFRLFLITFLHQHYGLLSIPLSACIFVYLHYINRWSNKMFSIKSYIMQFLFSLIVGFAFIYTNSIVLCIIFHSIFNCSELIIIVKRFRLKEADWIDLD